MPSAKARKAAASAANKKNSKPKEKAAETRAKTHEEEAERRESDENSKIVEEEVQVNETLVVEKSKKEMAEEKTAMSKNAKKQAQQNDATLSNNKLSKYFKKTTIHYLMLACVTILSGATRYHTLNEPKHVCWDETHFGKHANFYIKGEFFFDVHPPLAKMTIALAGFLTGYDGDFPFIEPGNPYGDKNYYGMRFLCAAMGALCIPLAYLIVWEMTRSTSASLISASFILFDTGCLTLSQYILLDPILMFYIMLAVFCVVKFRSQYQNPWSFEWWFWLVLSGLHLANAFSCKWVGLFVILWAGLTTIADLWDLLGNLDNSLWTVTKHFMARALCLIVLPVFVYLFWFALHFAILTSTGPGDGFFSSAFQSTLKGNELHQKSVPENLAYGSVITLKNNRPGGVLLHSHHHLYPEEHPPTQQQITGYSHKDRNNDWLVKKFHQDYRGSDSPIEYVKHGDAIILEHVATRRNLHSHQEKAPLTTNHHQVSGYGQNGTGDENDYWHVQIENGKEGDLVKTVKTSFRLVHNKIGCALYGATNTLPKWGWEQLEMTCNPDRNHPNSLWNIESHQNDRVPKASADFYRPSFLASVYESHIVMAQTNSGFKPKEGELSSQPWQWPINYRGQVFSGGDQRVYLLGNPVVWWSVLATIGISVVVFLYNSVREKRGYVDPPNERKRKSRFATAVCWLLVGWMLHYLPFYAMGRVLYFHHYFPAYLFSAMVAGIVLEYLIQSTASFVKSEKHRSMVYYSLVSFVLITSIISFWMFNGLSYGMSGPRANQPNCTQAAYKWMESWEI